MKKCADIIKVTPRTVQFHKITHDAAARHQVECRSSFSLLSGSTLSKPRRPDGRRQQAILDCLVRMLGRDYTVVGAIRDGPRAVDAVAILKPDVVVMDISMPEICGLDIARLLQENPPAPPVVFVTVHDDPEFMAAAQAVGAAGYVVKSRMETELKPAIELALKGQRFVLPAL